MLLQMLIVCSRYLMSSEPRLLEKPSRRVAHPSSQRLRPAASLRVSLLVGTLFCLKSRREPRDYPSASVDVSVCYSCPILPRFGNFSESLRRVFGDKSVVELMDLGRKLLGSIGGDSAFQKNIDYACGAGSDCSAISQNGACFHTNIARDHSSYAVNSYYQRKGQTSGSCEFAGTATVSPTAPRKSLT